LSYEIAPEGAVATTGGGWARIGAGFVFTAGCCGDGGDNEGCCCWREIEETIESPEL